jgi:para-nitrobenzyl esterase
MVADPLHGGLYHFAGVCHFAHDAGDTMIGCKAIAAVFSTAVILAALTTGPAFAHDPAHQLSDASVIMTDKGPVRGTIAETHREFLGVPYAAPPVGELRWKPPVPHASWKAPLDATAFRDTCAQTGFVPGLTQHSSENCLYLNIYTPNTPRPHLPVMVWIHGGAFVLGSGQDADGSLLAAKGKVIVVTINYRLGPFGFLAHRALEAESPRHVSGNYGLLDQQAALRWVRQNIAAFGGDASRVTIFGESAGGISVCLQLESPGADGLFQRAINESGPCQMTLPIAKAQAQGDKLAQLLGCAQAPDVIACMRSKPTRQVLDALPASPVGGNDILWFPVIDGVVLPQTTDEAFRSGKFSKVPFINGSNRNEGTLFVAFGKPITPEQYTSLAQRHFGKDAARVMEEYPLKAYPNPDQAWAVVFTDSFFSCPIRRTTRTLAPQTSVYAYEFNDPKAPNTMVPDAHLDLRAYHSAEIQYIFQTRFPNHPKGAPAPLSPQQLKLSDRMMSYWTALAASGHPDGRGPKWLPYQDVQDRTLSFEPDNIGYESDFAKYHHCAFWDTLNEQTSGSSGIGSNP